MIRRYQSELEEFEPWFMDDAQSDSYVKYISDELQKNDYTEGVITVRVDNDDMIHRTFVEKIKLELDGLYRNLSFVIQEWASI